MKITAKLLQDISDAYYDDIYKYCRKRVDNEPDAYDLTQEVFLALNQYYSAIDQNRVRQWLYKTAHNIVVDYHKMKKRCTVVSLSDHENEAEGTPYTFDNISDEMIDNYKTEILDNLSDTEKELYEIVYHRKTAYSELACKYGISEATLRKRISRLHIKIIRMVRHLFDE